jgi:protein-tyrosine phosphatase
MHWITDDVGVSGLHDLRFKAPVGAVLNVCEERDYPLPARLEYLHCGFPDVQPFPLGTVRQCVRWVDVRVSRGLKTLVHCAEGNSRSVTVVAAYLMHKGMPLPKVRELILERKPFVQFGGRPTEQPQYFQEGFLRRWELFLDECRAGVSR